MLNILTCYLVETFYTMAKWIKIFLLHLLGPSTWVCPYEKKLNLKNKFPNLIKMKIYDSKSKKQPKSDFKLFYFLCLIMWYALNSSRKESPYYGVNYIAKSKYFNAWSISKYGFSGCSLRQIRAPSHQTSPDLLISFIASLNVSWTYSKSFLVAAF